MAGDRSDDRTDDRTDDPADALYGLPLDQFTKERNALAKRLRADGDKDAGARVAGLRKPSAPAWALNQVARRHRGEVARYLDAAGRVRAAMAGDGDVRKATERLREVEAGLRRAALELAGANRANEVHALLAASAAEEDAGARLRAGRLLGDEADETPLAAFAPGTTGAAAGPRTDEVDAARRKRARDEAVRLAKEAERAEDEAERLEREAAEAEEQAEAAADRAERARAKAGAAREKAAQARAKADGAAGAAGDKAADSAGAAGDSRGATGNKRSRGG